MTVPDYQTLMLPVLRLAADGEKRVINVVDQIADELKLDETERSQLLPSGKQRVLHNRIHWAKFYLTKAGLITAPARGRFVATDEGRKLLASNPPKIDVSLLERISDSFRTFVGANADANQKSISAVMYGAPPSTSAVLTTAATPEEQIESAYGSQSARRDATTYDEVLNWLDHYLGPVSQ